MIVVIDYGMGNLHSVRKALEVAGARVKVSSCPADIEKAEKIVFPGVGAFGEAMKELGRRKLAGPIKDSISAGKPFLGLCLGLQLLFEKSEEAPGIKGLGVLKGNVKRFRFASGVACPGSGKRLAGGRRACERLKVPHMGWNNIKSTRRKTQDTRILKGIPDNSYMYFVHSYYAVPADKKDILVTTDYGMDFTSGVARDNIYALQFHPEKSQEMGLRILRNFVNL
jgi:glutamine amidotransferase